MVFDVQQEMSSFCCAVYFVCFIFFPKSGLKNARNGLTLYGLISESVFNWIQHLFLTNNQGKNSYCFKVPNPRPNFCYRTQIQKDVLHNNVPLYFYIQSYCIFCQGLIAYIHQFFRGSWSFVSDLICSGIDDDDVVYTLNVYCYYLIQKRPGMVIFH